MPERNSAVISICFDTALDNRQENLHNEYRKPWMKEGLIVTVKKLTKMLFAVNGLQFMLSAGILLCNWNHIIAQSDIVLGFVMGLMLLSSLMTMTGLLSVTGYQNQSYRESMENLENLNRKLREQRHDYLNQIQIVYGLLELEEYQEAREYIQPVFKDIMKVSKALKTVQPAVNALLQAKMETAQRQGIDFYLVVRTQLSELGMEPWEFCKVMGNLIDNALTAVAGLDGERRVSVEMAEEEQFYRFSVSNNGPEIPMEHRRLIFSQGFTTKKEEGHGIGLSIVTSVLREAKGNITFHSDDQETVFAVTVPKKEKKGMSVKRGKKTG